jgi:hypothetical protein
MGSYISSDPMKRVSKEGSLPNYIDNSSKNHKKQASHQAILYQR